MRPDRLEAAEAEVACEPSRRAIKSASVTLTRSELRSLLMMRGGKQQMTRWARKRNLVAKVGSI